MRIDRVVARKDFGPVNLTKDIVFSIVTANVGQDHAIGERPRPDGQIDVAIKLPAARLELIESSELIAPVKFKRFVDGLSVHVKVGRREIAFKGFIPQKGSKRPRESIRDIMI